MNLDANDSFRHSRAGKHAAAVRDGRHAAANAPTATVQTTQAARAAETTITVKTPTERAKAVLRTLNQIRPQCAGDDWVTLEIPRSLWSELRAVVVDLEGK